MQDVQRYWQYLGDRYFTWDKHFFPDPIAMQDNLAASGRKLVTIIDPHIKRDSNYYIYKEGQEKGLYVMNKDKQEFDGYGNTCEVCSALPCALPII